jgi:hypothetical protein
LGNSSNIFRRLAGGEILVQTPKTTFMASVGRIAVPQGKLILANTLFAPQADSVGCRPDSRQRKSA